MSGSESELDKLLQQAAERIYQRTQPYRYAVYLWTAKHPNQAQIEQSREIFNALTSEGPPLERAWAYVGLGGGMDEYSGEFRQSLVELRKAKSLAPDLALIYQDMDFDNSNLGYNEASLSNARAAVDSCKTTPTAIWGRAHARSACRLNKPALHFHSTISRPLWAMKRRRCSFPTTPEL